MTHKEAYRKAAKLALEHQKACAVLAEFENEIFGFEFACTDSDPIIDTINYGVDNYSFEEYLDEMNFYKKSFDENEGDTKGNGVYLRKLK